MLKTREKIANPQDHVGYTGSNPVRGTIIGVWSWRKAFQWQPVPLGSGAESSEWPISLGNGHARLRWPPAHLIDGAAAAYESAISRR